MQVGFLQARTIYMEHYSIRLSELFLVVIPGLTLNTIKALAGLL